MYIVRTIAGIPWSHDQLSLEAAIKSRDNAASRGLAVFVENPATGAILGESIAASSLDKRAFHHFTSARFSRP